MRGQLSLADAVCQTSLGSVPRHCVGDADAAKIDLIPTTLTLYPVCKCLTLLWLPFAFLLFSYALCQLMSFSLCFPSADVLFLYFPPACVLILLLYVRLSSYCCVTLLLHFSSRTCTFSSSFSCFIVIV